MSGDQRAARLMALFAGHSGAHGTHGEPKQDPGEVKWAIKSSARTLREPVTLALWESHLEGKRPLGIICIREDSQCCWGSVDVDEYAGDHKALVKKVYDTGLPLVPCRSKSGGLHLFLFLLEPAPAAALQSVLRDVAAQLGLSGSEIFPKQTQILAERGDLGNWMVMPYFGSTYGGKIQEQVGLKKTGQPMTIEEFLDNAEKTRVGPDAIATLGKARKRNGKEDGPADFSDGPPCLQNLAVSGVDNNRNNALFHMGVYFRQAVPRGWKKAVEEANTLHMKPALDAGEVAGVIRSLEKKDYEYTCKLEPMCSHCDSILCRSRRYGVGLDGDLPLISGLSRLDADPPIWFVDVMGRRLEVTTEQLQKYDLFHRACMEGLSHCFQSVKQSDWYKIVQEAMANVTVVEAPPEVSFAGAFYERLEEFLTGRQKADTVEDLFTGRPWQDDERGRHYFRLRDLERYLKREDVRDVRGGALGRNKLARLLSNIGGECELMRIKHRGLRVWWVPTHVIGRSHD